MGETRNAYDILAGKPLGGGPFGSLRIGGGTTLRCDLVRMGGGWNCFRFVSNGELWH
jgi:hypothetical protein